MTSVNYTGVDIEYYKKTSKDKKELKNSEIELGNQISSEGFVVLEKGNIPYSVNSTKLSLFSKSSVDFVFGGTGSGAATGSKTLKQSLENSGFEVNSALWDFYKKGKGKDYHRGIGSINYGDSDNFAINEVPLKYIVNNQKVKDSFDKYNTGVFVLSRTGGEGNDLARGMFNYVETSLDKNKGERTEEQIAKDIYKSYLEPDSIELDIMKYINDNFNDFILILNCNNAMELDFVKQFPKLKTIIHVPASGEDGLDALGKILKGETASSGRLVDTYVKDSFAHPSSQNIGDFEYLMNGKRIKNIMGFDAFHGSFYMHYDEGIYVGYRYFETRYADYVKEQGHASANNWKYEDNVIYPFGYGDSIAEFSYDNFNITSNGDKYVASVDITNTGTIKGKEVVELYVSKPYGDYEKNNNIEVSAVELLNFAKTTELDVNETAHVEVTFTKEDLRTYNQNDDGQYYLSGGDYYFTFGKDSHSANNNILRKQGYTNLVASPSEIEAGDTSLVGLVHLDEDLDTYKVDLDTGKEIKNQFDFANADKYDAEHKYLSRSNWESTYPIIEGNISDIKSIHSERTITSPSGKVGSFEFTKELDTESLIYQDIINKATHAPTIDVPAQIKWKQKSNLDFVDLRGLDINDPRYDEVVDKMSLSEAVNLFSNGGYETEPVKSINKPITFDTDGPAGFNTVSGHSAIGFSFPCSVLIAETWNKELMHKVGEKFGEEGLFYNVQGWYAPTANIHRNPFGGRNFEYFSEDPVLTGHAAKEELNGAAQYGLFGYLKHFALNDQETHREKENGVSIFANEQTIREIYLKAFEIAIKDNKVDSYYYEMQRDANKQIIKENGQPKFIKKDVSLPACTAVMTSFSRLGGTWARACYPLITTVLQEEWGFHGVILTDYYHNWFMNKGQSLLGGGSLMLDPQDNKFSIKSSDNLSQYMLKLATKNTLYGTVNSATVNNYIHGVKEIPSWPHYKTIVIIANVIFGISSALLAFNVFRIIFNLKLKRRKNA